MYNQLIYFIVVLALFGTAAPTGKPHLAHWQNGACIAAFFCFFILYCRRAFAKLRRGVDEGKARAALNRAYFRAEGFLSIAAIGFIALYLYVFNLGGYLCAIPGYSKFVTVSGLIGLTIYMLHMTVIWYFGQPVQEALTGSTSSRAQFIKGHASFSLVILIPWLLISIAADLLELIKAPAFMSSEMVQLGLIATALVAMVMLAPWLIIRMWGCKPLAHGFIRDELQRFCDEHDFQTGGLLLWPLFGADILTAGVVGILPRLRYILITPGLLRILDASELKAVLAHEMGHVRKKHMLLFVGILIVFILLVFKLGDTLTWLTLSNRTIFNWSISTTGFESSFFSLLSVLPIVLAMVIFLRFVFGYFLRNSERQADLYAMEILGTPEPLISSLQKIAFYSGRIEDLPSWHHYSIRQRVDFLAEASSRRELLGNHNRKLYWSVLIFAALASALLFANWSINRTGFARDRQAKLYFLKLKNSVSGNAGKAAYLSAYGAFLYEQGRYSRCESVLRDAINRAPDNAWAINNLAWLYATGPYSFRHPEDALKLALKAASLDPAPDILDTLAEAYFVNGMYGDAISTIDEALEEGGKLHDYLLKQKEKFQKALIGQMRNT
ncbi:MAG: M48 family metalloprotease [Syntrophobacteraceae bacterium]